MPAICVRMCVCKWAFVCEKQRWRDVKWNQIKMIAGFDSIISTFWQHANMTYLPGKSDVDPSASMVSRVRENFEDKKAAATTLINIRCMHTLRDCLVRAMHDRTVFMNLQSSCVEWKVCGLRMHACMYEMKKQRERKAAAPTNAKHKFIYSLISWNMLIPFYFVII